MNSGYNCCIDGGDNDSGHTMDAHKDVEVENAVHAFLDVHMGHCNRCCSNGRFCSLPSFCWESCCAQEDVSTVILKGSQK